MAADPASRPDDGGPCFGCGLCCDGTLFSRVTIAIREQDRLARLGFKFFAHGEDTCFAQPCRASADGLCAVYPRRPASCRTYRCALLSRYHAGEASLEEAKDIIRQAFELIDRAEKVDPAARHHANRASLRAELAQALAAAGTADRQEIADRLLPVIALDTFLARHFYKRGKDSEAMPGD